ncbi:phosphodiester glycosidase family protein [bacterium]|nr:phosphodiester glycosidase family protein [bacterium]
MKKLLFTIFAMIIYLAPAYAIDGMEYIHKEEGVHIYKIDTKKLGSKIKPYVADELTTAKALYETGNYSLVVNGGFFDRETGGEISFVMIDGKLKNSPFNNNKTMTSIKETGRFKEVVNRSELRIFELEKGKYAFRIAQHFQSDADKIFLKHSLQAGPMLAPRYLAQEEGFIQKDNEGNITLDSCNMSKRRPRTIIGIKGKYLYIIAFSMSKKMTGAELQEFAKKQRFRQALALDGGGSTSLITDEVQIISEGTDGRKVKSFLVIER